MGSSHDRRLLKRAVLRTMGENLANFVPEHIAKKPQEPPPKSAHAKSWFASFWGSIKPPVKWLISALLTIAGLLALWAQLQTKVSMTPGELLDQTEPFGAVMTFYNNGTFTTKSPVLSCEDQKIDASRHWDMRDNFFSSSSDLPLGDIRAGGHSDAMCMFGIQFKGGVPSAQMTALFSFRPCLLCPWRDTIPFYLRTVTDSQGHLHWQTTSR